MTQIPSHNHGGATGSERAYNDDAIYAAGGGTNFVIHGWAGSYVGGDPTLRNRFAHTHTVASQGGGAPHNNLQPYIVLNAIIKT